MKLLAIVFATLTLVACSESNHSSVKSNAEISLMQELDIRNYIWTPEGPGSYRLAFNAYKDCAILVNGTGDQAQIELCLQEEGVSYGLANPPSIDAFENNSYSISGTLLHDAAAIEAALHECVFFKAANNYSRDGIVWLSKRKQTELAQPLLDAIVSDSELQVYRRKISTSDWFINRELYKPCSLLLVKGDRKLALGASISD